MRQLYAGKNAIDNRIALSEFRGDLRLLDDSEARYLIDQFNKYSSWFFKGLEPMYPTTIALIAVVAMSLTIFQALGLAQLPDLSRLIHVIIIVLLLAVTIIMMLISTDITKEHESNLKKFIALENYRSKHKSLPDSLTLNKIIASKPPDIEKILAEDQSVGSG